MPTERILPPLLCGKRKLGEMLLQVKRVRWVKRTRIVGLSKYQQEQLEEEFHTLVKSLRAALKWIY